MLLHIALPALLLQAEPRPQARPVSSPPSAEMRIDAAGYAVLRFLTTWRTAWLQSGASQVFDATRLRDIHCHWDGSYGGTTGRSRPPTLIHRSSRRSMCPNWLPADGRTLDDERLSRDASLAPQWRARVRSARALLIDSLAIYAARAPNDAWITGERVRFLVDQGELPAALEVARDCTAERAWCAQLTGFVLHAGGDFVRADSAFDAATAAMSPEKQCEWTDARMILESRGQSAYKHLGCDERVAINERLWWLATPLFSDSKPDRRSEHYARKVLVQLQSALPWDERFDWRNRFGGEAVAEMLIRYGWPAFSGFGGRAEEISHASWMTFYDSTRSATIEYPQDRTHLVPAWIAIADPFHAPASAWQVNMPALELNDDPAEQWWPDEHYAPAIGPIVQLPDQTVVLRRDNDVLLASASDVRDAPGALHDDGTPVLVRTTGPRDVQQVPHQAFRNGTSIVVIARIPAAPAVVGTEVRATRVGTASARTRFGIDPPAPLTALRPGETAISPPVLIAAGDTPPSSPERALERMLGSTRVSGSKIGVYWETYGYDASDSVDVSVVITRRERIGVMRRVGMLLRVAQSPNGSVAVRWQEPQGGRSAWTIPGAVPVLARFVGLDLSRLEPGHYSVDVNVGRRNGIPVSASRDFVRER